jgi:hypothetical protein
MKTRITVLALAAAAALALAAPSTASAACNELRVNGVAGARYCTTLSTGLNGTTVSPTVGVSVCPWAIDPSIWAACEDPTPTTVGTTGVTPGTTPTIDAGIKPLHAKTEDTTVATVHVGGSDTPVTVPGVCYGSTTYC